MADYLESTTDHQGLGYLNEKEVTLQAFSRLLRGSFRVHFWLDQA